MTSRVDSGDARVLMRSDSVYSFLRDPAWSPDGQTIAIVQGTGGIAGEIWLQPVDGGPARRAMDEPGSVFCESPVFTPDGAGIIHSSNRGGATNIWLLPLTGRPPVRLTTGTGADESPSVSADRAIAFVNSRWRNTLEVRDVVDGSSRTLVTHAPFVGAGRVARWAARSVQPQRGGRQLARLGSDVEGGIPEADGRRGGRSVPALAHPTAASCCSTAGD